LSTPQLSVAGRPLPAARLMAQRALFRFLRPYWFQQRRFHTELLGALGQVANRLRALELGDEAGAPQLQELTRELLAANQEIRRLDTGTNSRFNPIEGRITRLENATTRHSEETRALGARIASLEARMTGLEDRTRPLEVSTDSLEARAEGLRTELQARQVWRETFGKKAMSPLEQPTRSP